MTMCVRQSRWGHRDATAILLAYRHGLRASESWPCGGTTSTSEPALHVRRSNCGTASVHPIGGRELRALRRLQREGQPGRYVFVSEHLAPPERHGLPADGRAGWRSGGLCVPDQQPRLAPFVRLQVSQRWARHAIDPTLSGPQVDCLDGAYTALRPIGSRISGRIDDEGPGGAAGKSVGRKDRPAPHSKPRGWGEEFGSHRRTTMMDSDAIRSRMRRRS